MKPVDTIIFDYGGVLADHHVEPFQSQLADLLHATQKQTLELTSEGSPHGRAYRLGQITKEEFWTTIKRLTGTEFDINTAHGLFESTSLPNPAMMSLVHWLKDSKGIRLGLASNKNADQWRHLQKLINSDGIFTVNTISCDNGCIKPEPNFYQAMIQGAGAADQSKILYVDDRDTHVAAAAQAGMQGYLFVNAGNFADNLHEMNLKPFEV